MQQTETDGADDNHKRHVWIIQAGKKQLVDRQEMVVNRENGSEDHQTADHLPEEHVFGFITLSDMLVGDGEQGVQCR